MNKQEILSEIKRTASGKMPLGRKRFYQETGIKDSVWGRYWARWNDALREAGFAPNRLRAAYDQDRLIEKYIALVRELGRFPTVSELRLKAYQTPGFPHKNTFLKWGRKHQIATRLRDFCAGRNGYEDILALCAPVLTTPLPQANKTGGEKVVVGSVYLVKSGRYYKIGHTNAVGRREYELGLKMPEKTTLIHEIRTDDPIGLEAYWHRRFESKRKGGEWFELNSADVRAFTRMRAL